VFTGPIEDRLAIRDLIDANTDAVNQRDADAWGAVWAEDGVWDFGAGPLSGMKRIVAAWKDAMASFSFVGFAAQPGSIRVDDGHASARVYTREHLVDQGGKTIEILGQYDDQFVRRGGRWLFRTRTYTVLRQLTGQADGR